MLFWTLHKTFNKDFAQKFYNVKCFTLFQISSLTSEADTHTDSEEYSSKGLASNVAMFHPYSSVPKSPPSLLFATSGSQSGLDLITRVADDILNGKKVVAPSGKSLTPEDGPFDGSRREEDASSLSSVDWQQLLNAEMGKKRKEKKQARRHPIHKVHKTVEQALSSGEEGRQLNVNILD